MARLRAIRFIGLELSGLADNEAAWRYAKELIEKARRIVQEQNDNAGENE